MDRVLFCALAGFLGGVFVHSLWPVSVTILVMGLAVSLVSVCSGIMFRVMRGGASSVGSTILFVAILSVGTCLGALHVEGRDRAQPDLSFVERIARGPTKGKATLTAVVRAPPEDRTAGRRFVASVRSVNGEVLPKSLSIHAIFSVPLGTRIRYGDTLTVDGVVSLPEDIASDDGRIFRYEQYLRAQNVHITLKNVTVKSLTPARGSFRGILFAAREQLVDSMSRLFPDAESGLVAGILLGLDGALSEEIETEFRRVGLVHIIVLSGSNVQIIAQTLLAMFSILRRRVALMATAGSLIVFALMVGLTATVVRATIMALIGIFANSVRRDYNVVRALLIALFIMICINPYLLVFDPSFQLSFLATLALIYLAPVLERYMQWVPDSFSMREYAVSTTSTQLFVTPFTIYLMGDVSVVGLVANMLVLPLVPLAMLGGFLSAALGIMSPLIAQPVAFMTHWILVYVLWIVKWFSSLPFALFHMPAIPFWVCISAYAVMTYALYRKYATTQPRVQSGSLGSSSSH